MKQFHKKFRHTFALLAMLTLAICGVMLGMNPFATFSCVALWQLIQIARSKKQAMCYNTVLSAEQIKEFEGILKSFEGYGEMFKGLKDLSGVEGGFSAIKKLPDVLKSEQKRADDLHAEVKKLSKQLLLRQQSNLVRRNGEVTDDCARHLGALALAIGLKRGQFSGKTAEMAESEVKEILGAEFKAALTSSDIPLPTEFSGQVVELVSQYGWARQYGTVIPLGAATVKLPKLSTDPTFGLIAQSGTVTEKSPQTAWVTFTAEKFGGLIRLPTELEADSIVPIGQFIARYAARNLARVEDTNFFVGTGAGSGINGSVAGLTSSTITNSKVTQMATTKTAYSQATLANFRSLRSVPDAPAIRTGAYYLHPSMEQLLASFNTAGDKPYNPNAQLSNPGQAQPFISGPTLDGFPVRWVDVMPAYSTSANVSTVFALFGDTSFQYLGIRGGVRFDTSMEAGFTTDEILIRALERMTIGLMANGAVAGLQTAAS